MSKEGRFRWRYLALTLLVIALVALFLWLVDFATLFQTLETANLAYLALGLLFFALGSLTLSARWRYVLSNRPAYPPTFYTDAIAFMANVWAHIPAPLSRVFGISRVSPVTIPQASSGVVVERLFEQIMRLTALVLTITLAVSGENQGANIVTGAAVIFAAVIFIFWLVRNQEKVILPLSRLFGRLPRLNEARVRGVLEELLSGLSSASTPRQLFVGLLLSAITWGFFYGFHLFTLLSIATELPPQELAGMAALALAVAPPSAPAMIGIFHGVLIGALSLAWPRQVTLITAYALLLHAVQLFFWTPTGLWGLTRVDFRLSALLSQRQAQNKAPQPGEQLPAADQDG